MPVRFAITPWRALPASALVGPEGSSTCGSLSGGAGAGTVGQARTSIRSKSSASARRARARTIKARAVRVPGSSARSFRIPRLITLSSGLSEFRFGGVSSAASSDWAIRRAAGR